MEIVRGICPISRLPIWMLLINTKEAEQQKRARLRASRSFDDARHPMLKRLDLTQADVREMLCRRALRKEAA